MALVPPMTSISTGICCPCSTSAYTRIKPSHKICGLGIVKPSDRIGGLIWLCLGFIRIFEPQSGHVEYRYSLCPRVHRFISTIRIGNKRRAVSRVHAPNYNHLICICGMTSYESSWEDRCIGAWNHQKAGNERIQTWSGFGGIGAEFIVNDPSINKSCITISTSVWFLLSRKSIRMVDVYISRLSLPIPCMPTAHKSDLAWGRSPEAIWECHSCLVLS